MSFAIFCIILQCRQNYRPSPINSAPYPDTQKRSTYEPDCGAFECFANHVQSHVGAVRMHWQDEDARRSGRRSCSASIPALFGPSQASTLPWSFVLSLCKVTVQC